MRKTQVIIPVVVVLLAGVMAWWIASFQPSSEKKQSKPKEVIVSVITAQAEDRRLMVSSQGTAEPGTETSLVTEVSGVVKSISPKFVAGGVFKKGDVLFNIDPVDYEVEVQKAEASLATSEAHLAEETARSAAEKKSWVNSGRVLKNAPPLLLRLPYVDEAHASVKASQAELKKAKLYLEKTEIRAPYDGMVKSRSANLGQFIKAGEVLGSIFFTDYVEIRLPVPASSLSLLDFAMFGISETSVPVTLSAMLGEKEQKWKADIVRSEGVVDERNRMHILVARLMDPYGLSVKESAIVQAVSPEPLSPKITASANTSSYMPLKVGTFVEASIQGKKLKNVIAIPRNLIRRNNEVLVVEEGVMRMKEVKVLYSGNSLAYISEGIKLGDQLITTAITDPSDGMFVKVLDH